MTETATDRWARELAEWAIPEQILAQRPPDPDGGQRAFCPDMFRAPPPGSNPPSSATTRAAAALDVAVLDGGGSVLDVGCGGGAAAFALVPPATHLLGVDGQADMAAIFSATALERSVAAEVHVGRWPDIADAVPAADVVVSHNVLYNVGEIGPFVQALHDHARRRVVVEITPRHPMDSRREAWKHFWGIERPLGPTAELAAQAIAELGIDVNVEEAGATERDRRHPGGSEAGFWCRHLCLRPEREAEVAAVMERNPFPTRRVVLWWDV